MTSNSNNRLKEIDNVQQDVECTLRSNRMKWNEFTNCDNDQLFCVRCIPMWMYLSFSLRAHVFDSCVSIVRMTVNVDWGIINEK